MSAAEHATLAGKSAGGARRTAPLSLRLSRAERAWLENLASGAPLGAYIKGRLFADDPASQDRRPLPVRDQRTIAQCLAQLGRSELATSMRDLADAARSGCLDCNGELAATLAAACADIRAMRLMLVTALGLKHTARAPSAAPPRQAFATVAPRGAAE